MSTLSIRRLPKELERALIREAKQQGKTKTEIVIQALRSAFRLGSEEDKRVKIRKHFGKMSHSDYLTFREATKEFSEIDSELWK